MHKDEPELSDLIDQVLCAARCAKIFKRDAA